MLHYTYLSTTIGLESLSPNGWDEDYLGQQMDRHVVGSLAEYNLGLHTHQLGNHTAK